MFSLLDVLLLEFNLCPFVQFVFQYETGWETGAVIALDDLSISRGSCFSPPIIPPDHGDSGHGNVKLYSAVSHTLNTMHGISILLFLLQFGFCAY